VTLPLVGYYAGGWLWPDDQIDVLDDRATTVIVETIREIVVDRQRERGSLVGESRSLAEFAELVTAPEVSKPSLPLTLASGTTRLKSSCATCRLVDWPAR
jgi:hypothetical protein